MGKRGPLSKSIEVKVAEGTYVYPGRESEKLLSISGDAMALKVRDTPPPPSNLRSEGIKKWNEHCERMIFMGILTSHDLDSLACYCSTYDEEKLLMRDIRKNGYTFTNDKGCIVANPCVAQIARIRVLRASYQTKFGMNPSDRQRIPKDGVTKVGKQEVYARKRG